MAIDTELDVLRSLAIGSPNSLAIWHDQRIAPVTTCLVKARLHFFHQEERTDTNLALWCNGKAVFGKNATTGHFSDILKLGILPTCLLAGVVVDKAPAMRRGDIRLVREFLLMCIPFGPQIV